MLFYFGNFTSIFVMAVGDVSKFASETTAV